MRSVGRQRLIEVKFFFHRVKNGALPARVAGGSFQGSENASSMFTKLEFHEGPAFVTATMYALLFVITDALLGEY